MTGQTRSDITGATARRAGSDGYRIEFHPDPET